MLKSHSVVLKYKKTTKGTQVYATKEEDVIVDAQYVNRAMLPTDANGMPPAQVKVTVEFDDGQ